MKTEKEKRAHRKLMLLQMRRHQQRAFVAWGLPQPLFEFPFHPTRRWRFDWAWVEPRVALEVDGGLFTRGRHSRGVGRIEDMEKANEATAMGWIVLRCTPAQLRTGEIVQVIRRALAIRSSPDAAP